MSMLKSDVRSFRTAKDEERSIELGKGVKLVMCYIPKGDRQK
jgi:hypothetical protein